MKILIFGKGYVASQFKEFYGDDAVISELYVRDEASLKEEIQAQAPDVVINATGKTGRPNVDWCEDHKIETLFSNVTVPLMFLKVCEELNQYWAHVGSGCVYAGYPEGGFTEEDEPNFFGSFYSRTKAHSEALLKDFSVLQLRLRMPIDGKPNPRNMIDKILKYPKIFSVPNSVSIMPDFLAASHALIEQRATGVFNLTNPGTTDNDTILTLYKKYVDPHHDYALIGEDQLNGMLKAKRSNCELSSVKLKAQGIHMRPVNEALEAVMQDYSKH